MAKQTSHQNQTQSAAQFIEEKRQGFVGKHFHMKDVGRQGNLTYECQAATFWPASNNPTKVAVIMRLELVKVRGTLLYSQAQPGTVEYRIAYYTVARNGRWHWGQFALVLPVEDLDPFLDQARAEGTLL